MINHCSSGRNIGYFGINQFEPAFEEVVFKLTKDGDVSMPVESKDWMAHLLKDWYKDEEIPLRQKRAKRKIQTFKETNDFAIAQATLIEKIKTESGYPENKEALMRL